MVEAASYDACVEAWLERVSAPLTSNQRVTLFQRAIDALTARARRTLGEVTLKAILDRVVWTASESHTSLIDLQLDELGAVRLDGARPALEGLEPAALSEAIRFFLVELLTLIGDLTGEIMIPALRDELLKVTVFDPREGTDS